MPLYDYQCTQCGTKSEHLMSYDKMMSSEVVCMKCDLVMKRLITTPAKTASLWNGGWNKGLSGQGQYSVALGKKVHNKREEVETMEARGFVREADLPAGWFEDTQAKQKEKYEKQDVLTKKYQEIVDETGDAEKAMVETFTADACLSGELDEIYDTKIEV